MATPFTPALPSITLPLAIDPNDCIGDSVGTLNQNTNYLAYNSNITSNTLTNLILNTGDGINGTYIKTPGTVLQIVHAEKNTTQKLPARPTTLRNNANCLIGDWDIIRGAGATIVTGQKLISVKPRTSKSAFLIKASISSTIPYVCSFGLYLKKTGASTTDLTSIGGLDVGGIPAVDNQSSQNAIKTVFYYGPANNGLMHTTDFEYMYAESSNVPNGTIYNFGVGAICNWVTDKGARYQYDMFINTRNTFDMRSISTLTITEIAQ